MIQNEVEVVYELSPMQQAMLFASLYAPGSGVYVIQLNLRLTGLLDLAAFEQAWRRVVQRHAVLRTGFHWEDLDVPLQVVFQEIDLELKRESWRGLSRDEQEARLQEVLNADRESGFELTEPPLMRLSLFDVDADSWHLVWSLHHLLVDGWSVALLLKELFLCYAAFAAGREPVLPPARSFGDYIEWLQRQDMAEAEAFWRESLAGLTAPTLVAGGEGGRDRGAAGFRQMERCGVRLGPEETASLRELARERLLTLNTLVQGAWALVLAQATGGSDVVFGGAVAGRPGDLPGVDSMIGLFINTLPVRVDIDPERLLLSWLADLQARQAEARRFEHAPLYEVQTWSGLPAGTALFDNILVFESAPLASSLTALLPELSVSRLVVAETNDYPLTLVVYPGIESSLELIHDASRIDSPAALRLLERLREVLRAFAIAPERRVSEVPLLLPGERQQVLVEWNDTASLYPREACLPELFAAVVRDAPDAPALISAEGEVWSYGRLAAAAGGLARHLRGLGVGPETWVGVCLERSPELIVSVLAVLQAGGAYAPLDAGYPDERLAFMLADLSHSNGGAPLVLADGRTRQRLESLEGMAHLLTVEEALWSEAEVEPAPAQVPAESAALVIYTSGSTGRPKGVALTHRGIVRMVRETIYARWDRRDRIAHLSNISFDAATMEVWSALLNGASLVIIPRDEALSPPHLGDRIRRDGVTWMVMTTALFNQVAREQPEALAPLRAVMFAGEAADPASVARMLATGGPELLNGYGPAEGATISTWHRVREIAPDAVTVSIGLPVANTSVYVLDRRQGPVPPGVMGELFIGGDGLARGYLNRPDLTAERFVPHPWSAGGRLYATGDLVRRRPDGLLEFVGRADNQVKIRGFRIEPGEIEAVLATQPEVAACAVLVRRDSPGKTPENTPGAVRLVAYVVPAFGEEPTAAGLREGVKRLLPDFMVPSAWVFLNALPLTPNGKVDRKALPAPEEAEGGGKGAAPAPADMAEELLTGIWAEVLGRERVSVHDDFFELGGHSLLATQVVSRIRGAFGVELPLRSVFEAPTVVELARVVREGLAARAPQAPPLIPIARDISEKTDLPLSFAQQRLWFIDRMEPGNPGYNIPAAVRLLGDLSVPRLAWVFAEVARRHEVLRTTFGSRDGRPVQVIHPEPLSTGLPVVDLADLPAPDTAREALARRLASEESQQPFDLEAGPLLRVTLLRLDGQEHLLLFTLHHIVSDGWSMDVLVREVQALYRGLPLPELPIQYADFAAWQRQWLDGEVLETQLAWWREYLAETSGLLELPTDHPRPAVLSLRGAEHRFDLEPELLLQMTELGRREGATPFMILAAGLLALLSRLSGQRDLNLGLPIANRNRIETEGLIGFFVNTLVLRADVGRAEAFLALLLQVREASLGAYAHQDIPFEKLVDEVQTERDLSRSPLVQVALAVNNAPLARVDLEGLRIVPEAPPSEVAKFDLAFIFAETGDGRLTGALQYATDLYDATTAVRLTRQLATFLGELTARPETLLADLSPLTREERHQVLFEWNDTAEAVRADVLLHQLFEERVDAQPEALAAVHERDAWSYRELEARANRLACFLTNLVDRGAPVGVWMERSLPMLASVLGILKAGGTYVPLDAAWPADRVETILANTGTPVILVDRATLPAVEKIRWRLPRLGDAICLDLEAPEPEPERVDTETVRSLFDFVAERATDRATAGGFVHRDTGLPFSEAEVDEYRDRVLSLAAPWLRPDARVLEVGSGSGLILWEMARRVERAVGLDPSERTQERNREQKISNVELPVGFAHEIGERFAPGSFDLVVLASTVQFFPGPRYLETVVSDALRLLAPGGALLVADVIDARVEPDTDKLALDEELFHDLGQAEILHRNDGRGGFANELGERYDVILRPGEIARRKRTWTGWHVERASPARPAAAASPEDVAYVIHTSGSTGAPKGIAVQHAPAVRLVDWVNRTFGVTPADRLLFITSLCFDLSVYDIFGTLAAGGTVHVASEAALREPAELLRLLREEPITVWDSAPAALQQLAPLFSPNEGETEARPLRLVMLSGDWIPVPLSDQVRAAFPGTRVMSLGGATEATVWSNWYPVREVDPRWPSIPYGRPIANARYHVLDEALLPCPIGVPGDLYIGGACLCVGYAGQPELTAASFIPDPFSGAPGARLYRTGDRSRSFRDGNLEFLGRVDQQVKVRGYRIELGEIEVALLRHPDVREAVAGVLDGRLVAWVVLDPADRTDPADAKSTLAAWLHDRLPQYMLPSAFVLLDALPVTANGKLDRKALPPPREESEGGGAAARTPVEELLAEIWKEVLGRERVGVDESFFELGGHSLLVMQLLARLRSVFGVDLAVRRIFEAPTVTALARVVEEELHGGAFAPPSVAPVPHQGGAPLSSAQSRIWFEQQLDPDSAAYNVPLAIQIDGPVRVPALAAGLREVVRRHEALRTTFQEIDGELFQVAGPPADAVLLHADLTALPPHRREEQAARLARWIGDAPFDLERGPVFRALVAGLSGGSAEESFRLLITVHHIALDGWSGNVLTRELIAAYQAFAQGRAPVLPDLPVQFADFAHWERSWMQGEVRAEHQRYWLGQLAGLQEPPELPGDRSRPAVPTWRAGWSSLRVDADLAGSLRELGRAEGSTLFMTLLAAFDALLHLHTGDESIVIGSAGANRIRPEVEPLIGCFLNLLALRSDLSGRPTFRELLARARETALGAYAHQGFPFDWLMAAWQRGRADRDTRIFHMLLEMQGGFAPVATLDGLTFRWVPFLPAVVKYDLTVYLREEDGGALAGDVAFNTDRFSSGWIERLLADFRLVLEAMVRDPDREVASLDLTGTAELRAALATDLSLACPPHENIRLLVRRSAAVHAERIAIESGDGHISYRTLEAQASAWTDRLLLHGLPRGAVVGVLTYASSRLVTAMLGIFEAGGIFLPLDPRVPAKRLATLVEEASPRWFLVDPELAGLVAEIAPETDAHILVFDEKALDVSADGAARPARLERPEMTGDDPCYIYFTSGSTGRPKGVTGRLRGIDHFVRWEIETFGLGGLGGPRVSQIAAPTFDAFLRDAFVPLSTGGTICAPPDRELLADAEWLAEWIDQRRVELIHCVPSLFRALLGTELTPARLTALRTVIMAGEAVLPADVQRCHDLFGTRIELVNLYGNSETTMAKFIHRVRPEDAALRTVPAGRPMPGAQGLILDALGRFRPAGVVGEIVIRTPYRSLGYYNQLEETRRAFVPNPLGNDPEDLLYRSGDLGRLLEDGNLEFLGRRDQQVKVRGVRVELEEIEGVLARHDDVREAAVVEQPDRTGGVVLASFVVLRPGCDAAPLRGWLAERLPDTMVPSRFFAVEELPRSMNGKIDRAALRALAGEQSGAEAEHVAPRSELEGMLAGLFSHLLGVDRVGARDNFFQLGGHSLLAAQLVARVRHALDLDVPLRSLLQHPTVAGLAHEIETLRRSAAGAPEEPPLVPAPRGASLPLSFAQQRLWFLHELEPGSPAYNMPFGLRLSGRLDVPAFRATFRALVQRHESLRTVFRSTAGVPRQVVLSTGAAELPVIDLSALPAAVRELQLSAEVAAAFWRPFDLERGPLVRASLFRLADEEHAAVFCLHHIVSDGWSLGILFREITALYAAAPLPPLPVQYADFACWQRSWLQGEALERQIDYWRQSLAGAEPLALPVDRSAARGASAWVPGRHWFSLPAELTARLQELARGTETTLFMVTLAALDTLLLRISGQRDLSIGIPVANRTRVELEGLIGFFVNTLVLRTGIPREATFRDLLQQVRTVSLEAQAHQDVPFEKLIEELDPERNLEETPLFRVMFDLTLQPPQAIRFPGLSIAPLSTGGGQAKFDLLLNLRDVGGTLQGYMEYRAALFEPTTIQRWAGYLLAILESAVAVGNRRLARLGEIPMLGAAERHQVVVERNERRRDAAPGALFSEMLAAQVRRNPEATALMFDRGNGIGRITYGELAARAGRLARWLAGQGVGPGVMVALCMDRTPFLTESILGVLLAGGGYLPLEPDLPGARMELMLQDSGARLLLTRASLRPRVPALVPVVCLDRDLRDLREREPLAAPQECEPVAVPSPHDPAVMIYTSGSTGRPKGVVTPHGALAWFARMAIEAYGLRPTDRILQVCSIGFDVSLEETFPYLACGAALCLWSDPLLRSPASFLEQSRHWGVTAWSPPTAFWHAIVDQIGIGAKLPSTLRLVALGGEAVSPAHLAVWRARVGSGVRLINTYGPTETTVVATLRDLRDPSAGAEGGPVPIGRPLPGAEVHLLDDSLEPVPLGVTGEIFLGSRGGSWGYLGHPDLTAERFVPHPFAAVPGERLYRTGDLGRALADGDLEFVGRTDHQVKIRGFRVEPGEVDAVLGTHPQVLSSVTLVWEPTPGAKRLATWFVAQPGEAPPLAGLRSYLQARLPSYMVPAALEPIAEIPLTRNGKVDRRALPAPQSARAAAEAWVAPSGPVEEVLAGIWAEVLRVDRVGAHDNFFALGGHSLLATQVVSRAREALGVELPLRRLFEAPTIHQIAQGLLAEQPAGRSMPALAPAAEDVDGDVPLSFAQQRLWFLDQLEPGNPAYNISSAVRITGALSVEALEKAFTELVRRHAALRTTFAVAAGQPVQVIAPAEAARPEIRLLDLSDAPEEAREEWALELAREEARHPFDLRNGPLLRLGLLRLTGQDHLLLVNLHHIVSDGWSMNVLLREIGALYPAFLQSEPSPLPELPLQYADFARWQRSWLQGEVLERLLAHWTARLAGAPAFLELPTDRPRPAVQTYRGASVTRTLPPAVSAAVHDLCRTGEVTPFMVLLATWAAVLGRHAGQDDLLVGSPIAGRNHREVEELIGFFVNTLVLRVELSGASSFDQLLKQVRQTSLDAFAHQELPLELLVDALAVERSLAHTPLIQVLLTLQNAPADALRISGLTFSPVAGASTTAKFDLALTFTETAEGFAASLEYATDLFDRATAERLLAHLGNLLASAAEDPGRPLSDLRLMDAAEERLLQIDLNRTERTWAIPVTVHELFARQAERSPDRIAAVGPQGALSYREIDERSSALAARLGAVPDRRIALPAAPDPQVLIGMLGILKAGAGFVPIDPRLPAERAAWIREDAGCEVPVAQQSHLGSGEPRSDPGALRACAYVVYTSGSTGRPKGVQVAHESLVPMLLWGCAYFGLGAHSRVLQSLSPSFDFGIFEHLTTVLAGGTLVFPGEAAGDPELFAQEIVRQGIDTLHTTPVFARELARTTRTLDSLEILHLGGEALSWDTVARLREVAPRAAFYNGYGPTEATINSSIFRIGGADGSGWPTVPIGQRSADNTLYVLDRAGRLVPFGARGELHVGGVGVARGYLGRPDLTAERFVPDPFGSAPGGRLYRTGDLVRHLPGGDLEFLGRIDHQVKLRGFRIELGEIEAVLRSHPAIAEAVVSVWEEAGDRRLAAWVVIDPTDPTDRTDPSDLRSTLALWLRGKLPEPMVPSAFVVLDALPLTPTGKVDRKALPAPERGAGASAYVAPGDAMEEQLAEIWREVLRLDRIGIHDNFFALGGHSLLATQVVSRVREVLRIDLPLRHLFEAPTIRELALRLQRLEPGGGSAPILSSAAVSSTAGGLAPLSFAQQRLWLLDQLEPGNPAYNIPLAVRVSGELSLEALERTFTEVVRRHAVLRTTFAVEEGQPVQVIAPGGTAGPQMRLLDLSDTPEDAREEWARELAAVEAWHPFDLQTGPLLRLGLLRLAEQEHLLLVHFHHIVADGWSMSVLLREIGALYPAFLRGEPSPLPELSLQYADFSRWQRSWLQGEVLERQLAHWTAQLAGAPTLLELPTDQPRPAVQTYRGANITVALPPGLSAAVQVLCRAREATPFMALLAAWAAVLGRHAGQEDLLVGSPIAGRNRRETEDLIGFFVNTLVLRTDVSGAQTFDQLLAQIRHTALEAFAHQDLPFELLVDALAVERSLAHAPLFQVMLTVQNAPTGALRIPGLTLAPVDVPNTIAKFDLALSFVETAEGFTGSLSYATDLFDHTTAERLLGHLVNLLTSAAEAPGRPLSELRLMGAAEERLLQTDLNRTERTWAIPVTVHELFARQAERSPDRIAAVGPHGALSYREIDERSSALAARLGAVPDRRIALPAAPDPQVLIGMLGILKAGAGFVPIDPRLPAERAAWIREDAGCEVPVTQQSHLGSGEPRSDPGALRACAYVVYTSGSTGRPKGVQVAHESLVPMLLWGCAYFGLGAHSRVLQSLSPSFDFGIFEHLTTVLAGGTLHFPGEAAGDPEAFAGEIVRHGIDTLHTTPVFARELARTGRILDSLEVLHLGGEALSWDTVARLREAAPRAVLYNGYGPTEATVNSSIFRVGEAMGWPTVPIGRPSAENALYVLDRAGRLVPFGARGELHVGGIGVARGYLGRPDLTAERFVPDPFGSTPGGRLYRTGDLVRWLPSGDLSFLGRIDAQVKLRGFRIELGEIEAALRSHPAVEDAVVQLWEDAGDRRLAAWVAVDPVDRSDDPSDLQAALAAWLRGKLPEHMVPSALAVLDALPLTATGKVDRRALPAPDRRAGASTYVAPGDAVEETLAEIWREVLRLDQVGVHDNFFTLGGHSLLATQVITRVREKLGTRLPLRSLFEAPTIHQLSRSLRDADMLALR